MNADVYYWTQRMTGRDRHGRERWQLEDGWAERSAAEDAARFYRQTFRRPCRVIERPRPEGR